MDYKYKIRILSSEDIKKVISMEEAIEVVKEAFKQLSTGKAMVPQRSHLEIKRYNTTGLIMPVYLPENKQIGVKLINLSENNPQKGLPLSHAITIISDAENGMPLAVMDGTYLTALRTGAASGVASQFLSRENSGIAVIFGAGIQGRTQLEAIYAVRPIKKAFIFDIEMKKAQSFANEMSEKLSLEIEIGKSLDILNEADIICTATNSKTPVFSDKYIKEGSHINAIGSYKPHIREIPGETVKRAKIVVDHLESCLSEAGDLIIPIRKKIITKNHIHAEIGEIIAGLKKGRISNSEITFFKSVGNAVQDLAVASLALKNAEEKNLGFCVHL